MSCLLRRVFNRDSKFHAIPSGLLAGLAFGFFPDNTVALYVMWKSLQVSILIHLQVVNMLTSLFVVYITYFMRK